MRGAAERVGIHEPASCCACGNETQTKDSALSVGNRVYNIAGDLTGLTRRSRAIRQRSNHEYSDDVHAELVVESHAVSLFGFADTR